MRRAPLLLTAALALGATLGCGPQFDPSSEIRSLRVLTVKKDKPYAQPGETVNLQMLWHDAKGPRDVQRLFIGGCVNPPADLYYGCFPQIAQQAANGDLRPGGGDSFDFTLPKDIISSREGRLEPGQAPYGLAIVFFALCAGQLDLDTSAPPADGSSGLPVRCLDDDDQPLDSEDFVVGYTSIYSFEGIDNHNPGFVLDDGKAGFKVDGKAAPADCVGDTCVGAPDADVEGIDCSDESEARCVAACADDGDSSCPGIQVAPVLDETVETDEYTSELVGAPTGEQMWVNYYVDRGGVSEVRLVNDVTTGWNAEYRGELRAPKDPGPLKVWAVVHDNRGGIDFTRVTLMVK
jgi:hypothetical protein